MWSAALPGGVANRGESQTQEKLDRALVGGLMLEVLYTQQDWPRHRPAQQEAVKRRLQEHLVHYLAGRVSLDHFRRLVQQLDSWFDHYFSLLAAVDQTRPAGTTPVTYRPPDQQPAYAVQESRADWLGAHVSASPSPSGRQACWEELLASWLAEAKTEMPQRPHRKLTPEKLRAFLCQSGGRWFRLRDFERFVEMDRKTAWDYLQQFLQAGLLCHNRKQSAAVRYCLAPSFLKVEADALRLAITLCLISEPEEIAEKIGDFLVATGGEPFSQQEWDREIAPDRGQELLTKLAADDILISRQLANGTRFWQLHPRWRQEPHPPAGPSPGPETTDRPEPTPAGYPLQSDYWGRNLGP